MTILDNLKPGHTNRVVPYGDRNTQVVDRTIVPRRVSSCYFIVVQDVPHHSQAQHIASIVEKTSEANRPCKRILCDSLDIEIILPRHSNSVGSFPFFYF